MFVLRQYECFGFIFRIKTYLYGFPVPLVFTKFGNVLVVDVVEIPVLKPNLPFDFLQRRVSSVFETFAPKFMRIFL
jgi:hypothetical protein